MSLKVETENTISSGVDESARRIFFGRYLPNADVEERNAFDQITVEYAVRAILKMIDQNSKKPIEIHMNSYGGDPYAMMYLHDVIVSSPCQFKFFGGGAIMSAATWIMAACDERYLYKNARIMVHSGSLTVEDRFPDAEIYMAEEKRLQEELEHLYAHNSRMPKSFWTEVCKRDMYLSADEAIILGLADKLIEPKKRGNLRKVRQAALSEPVHHSTMKKTLSKLYNRIQYPVALKDITLNDVKPEEVDETLTIEEGGGPDGQSSTDSSGNNGTNSGTGDKS